ncbi:MAG: glutamine synthetase [Pseudomonadales bacterium]|nr:glutamine synthetase [Pseudomonadales bacterium]
MTPAPSPHALIGLSDIDGVIRGKFLDRSKLHSVMQKGGGFCDCVFGWDVDDQLYDFDGYTGWGTGFPDCKFRVMPDSKRTDPDAGTEYYIGEFCDGQHEFHPICPRSCLRRVLKRLSNAGFRVRSGFEYELFVFKESPASVRTKNYQDLVPLTPGNFGYSVLRAAAGRDMFEGLLQHCRAWNMPLEGLHCETGPGVWEAALQPSVGLEAADRANLFKTFSKVYFQPRDAIATFMAKWSMRYPGQSGHYHFSLETETGDNQFVGDSHGLSDIARYALGGLVRYVPEWLPLLAPTVNSFTRLVKGAWAPTAATWGRENRTCAFRFIPGDNGSQRIENRVPGADANPYLAASATLAAMACGIEQKLEPPEPVIGNAYDLEDALPSAQRFSPTLRGATSRLRQSDVAREVFGSEFVDHFVATRLWESEQAERHVNSWQLERYFESI